MLIDDGNNPLKLRWPWFGFATLAVVGLIVSIAIHRLAGGAYQAAWQHYLAGAQAVARGHAQDAAQSLGNIYQNLRTISYQPTVRKIDRHGGNLSEDGHETIQQNYNILASNVDVSEIYILPADFDPIKLDAVTLRPEEPILMFDHFIDDNAPNSRDLLLSSPAIEKGPGPDMPEEVEIHEYIQLQQQLGWFKQHYPDQNAITNLEVPMISGRETITCDNSVFNATGKDADRSGLIFSVPFFGPDGKFKGSISAIILSKAVQKLVPEHNYALVSPGGEFVSARGAVWQDQTEIGASSGDLPDADSSSYEMLPVAAHDPRGAWTLRAEFPASNFYAGKEFAAIRFSEIMGYGVLGLLMLAGFGWMALVLRQHAVLSHRATHDMLTDLPNRHQLLDVMKNTLARSGAQPHIAVLYLDLDRFKLVNDTKGHAVGDTLLQAVVRRLQKCTPRGDTLARIGGDEFIVLQHNVRQAEDASGLAHNIIKSVAEPFQVDGHEFEIGVSVGVAMEGADAEALLRNADMALFRVKSHQRGSCRFYERDMDTQEQTRRQLEADIKKAVPQNELVLHYQAFVDARTEKITGFEALLRWNHPTRGVLSPFVFIDIAEESGAIVAIGEWVIRQACLDAAAWPSPVKIAVNLSAVQFKSPALPAMVKSALENSSLAPSRLELEITESVSLADNNNAKLLLGQLQDLGVKIALDDFGTGYSSLSYLRAFKFNKIKIDRSFVREMTDTGKDIEIIKSVAALAFSLGMTTTAEGIETAEQLQWVREQGCTELQGYYFSRPVAFADATKLLAKKPEVPAVGAEARVAVSAPIVDMFQ